MEKINEYEIKRKWVHITIYFDDSNKIKKGKVLKCNFNKELADRIDGDGYLRSLIMEI